MNSSVRMPLSRSRWKNSAGVPSVPTLSWIRLHLHALALLLDQGIREAPADLVILEDVGLHVDVVARRLDGREHRPIGVRAVLQQSDPIAGQQRAVGDGLLEREVTVEDVGVVGATLELRPGSPGCAPARAVPVHLRPASACVAGAMSGHDPGQRTAARQRQAGTTPRDDSRHDTRLHHAGMIAHRGVTGLYATAHTNRRRRRGAGSAARCATEQTPPPGRVVLCTSTPHDPFGNSPHDG